MESIQGPDPNKSPKMQSRSSSSSQSEEDDISFAPDTGEHLMELCGRETTTSSESRTLMQSPENNQMQIATWTETEVGGETENLELVKQSFMQPAVLQNQSNTNTESKVAVGITGGNFQGASLGPQDRHQEFHLTQQGKVTDLRGAHLGTKNIQQIENQTTTNIQHIEHHHHYATEQGPTTDEQIKQKAETNKALELEFIKLYNEETERNTEHKITETFGQLNSPSREVNPEYLDLGKKLSGKDTTSHRRNYTPYFMYKKTEKPLLEDKEVQMSQFLDDSRYTAIIGSMGSGKTTTAMRFAKSVVRKEIPSLSQIELVHLVSIADLNWDSKIRAYDLIFHQPMGSKAMKFKEFGPEWVLQHGGKILLVLDGLDQSPQDLWRNTTKVAYDTEAAPHTVLHNILCQDLIPGCKIISTSRALEGQTSHPEQGPDKIVYISQFKSEDCEFLIKELAGEKGEEISKYLQEKAPGLWSLCRTPVYLTYTVACIKESFEKAPSTTTAILIRVLKHLIESKYKRIDGEKLVKLCKLAFGGTSDRRVVFRTPELSCLGLSERDVSDLLTTAADGQHLTFLHQSLQEVLSALHIAKMEMKKFQEFIQNHFDDSHFQVVKNIVAGILLNEEVNNESHMDIVGNIDEDQAKREFLEEWIRNQITKLQGRKDVSLCLMLQEIGASGMELFLINYENFKLEENLHGIELHAVVNIMAQCHSIKSAEFSELPISDELDKVSLNTVLKKCEKLEVNSFHMNEMSEEHLLHFCDCLNQCKAKLNYLRITLDQTMSEAFSHLAKVIESTRPETLELVESELSQENMQPLSEALAESDIKLKNFYLTENRTVDPATFSHIAKILESTKTETLGFDRCELSKDKLHHFSQALIKCQVKVNICFEEINVIERSDGAC